MESSSSILEKSPVPPEEIIFVSGIFVALALVSANYEDIGGNPIPTVIFNRNPSLFHVFLMALNLGVTSAVTTIFVRAKNKPIATICRKSAIVCCVVAAVVLSVAALASYFPSDFSRVYSWFS